jgi:hypothetical protein
LSDQRWFLLRSIFSISQPTTLYGQQGLRQLCCCWWINYSATGLFHVQARVSPETVPPFLVQFKAGGACQQRQAVLSEN